MNPTCRAAIVVMSILLASTALLAAPTSQEVRQQLIDRLRAVKDKESAFGPAYQPIYHAMIPWYENWGSKTMAPVDKFMTEPDEFARQLADALEHNQNFIADHAGSGFPLVFDFTLPDGKVMKTNYQLSLPDGFPSEGKKFPLIVGLHGSGWLAHRISYVPGGKTGGRTFGVTPINEGGAWNIDFLNGYLDELIKMLPVDTDHVYTEGHSLGAMGALDWAMNNPERFAAVSPRDGNGQTFRAIRLKNVPTWVIHGSEDDTILPGYADQMVTALQAVGGTVKYSLLKGAPHNLPADFDQKPILDWYLQQTRSKEPAPADPINSLGIDATGFSPYAIVDLPAGMYWKSKAVPVTTGTRPGGAGKDAEKFLFKKVEDQNQLVDSPTRQLMSPDHKSVTYYLATPKGFQLPQKDDPDMVQLPARKAVKFYSRGDSKAALDHVKEIAEKLKADGKTLSDQVWITQLTPSRRAPNSYSEYWIELK